MPTVLFDAFHHMPSGHKIGPHITVGGYVTNVGRYFPGDVYHPNGLAGLVADLAYSGYELRTLHEPLTDGSLAQADILLLPNPDYPLYEGSSPFRWTPDDVEAVWRFLQRGGGVLLLVNSFLSRPDFWEENFDYERISPLFDKLGVRWDPNYMSDAHAIERAESGDLIVGYGQGGRLIGDRLPQGFEPLLTFKGNTYGFVGRVGDGTLAVIGDTGLISNGLLVFPGFENAKFLERLFKRLRPSWCDRPSGKWSLRRFAHLSSAPTETGGMSEKTMRSLRPQAEWMVDHHYRHLYWDLEHLPSGGDEVWSRCPVRLDASAAKAQAVKLRWLTLDSDRPGAEFEVKVAALPAAGNDGTDIRLYGRHVAESLPWSAIAERPETFAGLGTPERVHCIFELQGKVGPDGRPRWARWRQGQTLYARSPGKERYGYEVILSSQSGSIGPSAG
jgi:hypothetical protein